MPHIPRGVGIENPRSSHSFRSMSQIEIHTTNGVYAPGKLIDPSQSLVSWNYKKQLSSSSSSSEVGTLTLTLTAGIHGQSPTKRWDDLVAGMDLLVVYVSDNGPANMRTRFIGYITDITYQEDTGSNPTSPQRNIVIQAQDLVMGLMTELIWAAYAVDFVQKNIAASKEFNKFYTMLSQSAANYQQSIGSGLPLLLWLSAFLPKATSSSQLFLLTPSQATNILMQKIMPTLFAPVVSVSNHSFSGHATWLNLIAQRFADTSQFAGALYYVQPQDGSMYETIQPMMNAPFLEFFGDVRSADQMADIPGLYKGTKKAITFGPDNATFNLVIRNTPYDTTSGAAGTSSTVYEKLVTTDVYLKDQSQRNWGTTTSDVVNYFFSYPEGYMQQTGTLNALNVQYGALVDAESVVKYGLQPLILPILGFPQSGTNAYSPSAVKAWNQTLYDWYHLNPLYIRGTATIHGNPAVRVGTRIRFPTLGLTGYAEGLQEDFVNFQSYTSQVTFSRGVYAS